MGHPYYCSHCIRKPRLGTWEYCSQDCAVAAEEKRKQTSGSGIGGAIKGFATALWSLDPLDTYDDSQGRRLTSSKAPRYDSSGPTFAGSGSSRPLQSGRSQDPNGSDELCEFCHLRAKHQERDELSGEVRTFPFCGRTCRNLHAQTNLKYCGLEECKKPLAPKQAGFCSDKHAKKAVSKGEATACSFCKVWPVNPPHGYCSKECGIRDQLRRTALVGPLTGLKRGEQLYSNIENRFIDRWRDPSGRSEQPTVHAILQINLPKKYETRFTKAVEDADKLGGSTTKSAFYGGQCICDVGVLKEELCNWGSCSICIVARRGFDLLECNNTEHNGSLGKGIYANLNPAMAHRFTVRKTAYPFRAMILCSVVVLDDFVRGDRKKSSALVEENGRVYCSKKDFIIPRQLIIYNEPPTLP